MEVLCMKAKNKILYVVVATAMGVNMIPANVQATPPKAPVLLSQTNEMVEYEVQYILDESPFPIVGRDTLKGKKGELTKAVAKKISGYHAKPFQQKTLTEKTIVQIYYERDSLKSVGNPLTTIQGKKTESNADYTKVNAAIQKANALNKNAYKDFSKVQAALDAVVFDKKSNEQAVVDGYATAIETAIQSLEAIETVDITFVIDSKQGWVCDADWNNVTKGMTVEKGKPVDLHIGSKQGYTFINMMVNDQLITDADYTWTPQTDTTITILFEPVSVPIQLNMTEKDFGTALPGYDPIKSEIITVENKGSDPILLMAPQATNYEISLLRIVGIDVPDTEFDSKYIEPGEQLWFTIRPKDNLAVGKYDESIVLYEFKEDQNAGVKNPIATLNAKFTVAQKYELNTSANPAKGGMTSGDGVYDSNAVVKVTAKEKEGYKFVHWTENGQVVSTEKEMSVTMDHDTNLVAVFKDVEKLEVETSCAPLEGGTTVGDGIYNKNDLVKVSAIAKEGYEFSHWQENGQAISEEKELTFKITEDRYLLAVFHKKKEAPAIEKVKITTNVTPKDGGIAKGAGIYKEKDMVSVLAQAKPGYQFVHWVENGKVVSKAASFTFKAEKDRNLVAVFRKKAKVPTALSTNVFSWLGLSGLSVVTGTVLFKKKKNKK